MKWTYHIPTEQYGFVEVETDMEETYESVRSRFIPGNGLEQKDWNAALDRYLTDGTGDVETWEKMSPEQQMVFQEIKKANKRINKI